MKKEEPKICPLLSAGSLSKGSREEDWMWIMRCQEEKCALWSKTRKICGLINLGD